MNNLTTPALHFCDIYAKKACFHLGGKGLTIQKFLPVSIYRIYFFRNSKADIPDTEAPKANNGAPCPTP
jgi:hypothetical protein